MGAAVARAMGMDATTSNRPQPRLISAIPEPVSLAGSSLYRTNPVQPLTALLALLVWRRTDTLDTG